MKHAWLIGLLVIPACGDNGGGAGGAGGSTGCAGVYSVAYRDVCEPAAPMTETVRTLCSNPYGIREYCANDTNTMPQIACLPNKADSSAPATPASATLTGFVKVFSAGPSSDAITVQVFNQADLVDANSLMSATSLGTFTTVVQNDITAGTARACPQPEQGTAPPPCVVPTNDCQPPCATTDYCSSGTCIQRKRYEARYSIPNIPTNTPLAIRTSGPQGVSDSTWAPMVQFRVILPTNDPTCATGDTSADLCWKDANKTHYEASVAVLSRSDYNSIPTSVGLSAGITAGHGAIAGEVRDCTDVRLEHATVGYSPTPDKFAYFNSIPFMTLPASGKLDTDALGLFSGMNLPAGKVRVRAQGKVGGNLVDLGGADAIIFHDTVSIVGINAGRPIDQP